MQNLQLVPEPTVITQGDIHEPTDLELQIIEDTTDFSGAQQLQDDFRDLCQYSEGEARAAAYQVEREDEKNNF